MMKMYTHPAVVHAVTDRVCSFYYEANERFFALAGDLVDGFFFGNDFGTQRGLICGPKQFDEFILPWFQRFTDQAHRYGYQVILHSCGSICSCRNAHLIPSPCWMVSCVCSGGWRTDELG